MKLDMEVAEDDYVYELPELLGIVALARVVLLVLWMYRLNRVLAALGCAALRRLGWADGELSDDGLGEAVAEGGEVGFFVSGDHASKYRAHFYCRVS